ncbi:MAG TPA: class I SAM-dependent methyltransferase [Acidimicrobiales bacterium]|nr:class I SAM-dependent methyltransferase [Acidimicrobiales bacterium]
MRHWFEPMAEHMGEAYLRYSFTKGTEQEVDFLVDVLALTPGDRVLDVGCGPGRHAHALARRGMHVVGVDISARFVDLASRDAPPTATFRRCDARDLPYEDEFDAVISLCQGAFGLVGEEDHSVLEGMARAARSGGTGRVALTAFSAYFALRYLEEGDVFDADAGVHHERAVVKNEAGEEAEFEAWTSCFTPRELRLLCDRNGLRAEHIWAVTPGAYGRTPPDIDHPEFLVVARKPTVGTLS